MEGIDESAPYPEKFHAPYPETKALAEQMVLKATSSNLNTIILRPHLIWGPGDNHLMPGIVKRAKRLKRVGRGKNIVDTIYIDNAADAHILAADRLKENPSLSGSVYFISQNEPVSLWKMVNDLLDTAGLPPVKGAVSASTAMAAGTALEIFYRCLKFNQIRL